MCSNKYKRFIIRMATEAAKADGYDHVVIKGTDGIYSHSRKYEGCCPNWFGKIVGIVKTYWENGIMKTRYENY